MSYEVDYEFLSKLEGGCRTGGYIPDLEKSKSGVTIATGFDFTLKMNVLGPKRK